MVGSGGVGQDVGAVADGGDFPCEVDEMVGWEFRADSSVNIPCKVGLPVEAMELAPIHTSSPRPLSPVWLTMAVPNAPNGHGETKSWRA
jgi:hypothetical protein